MIYQKRLSSSTYTYENENSWEKLIECHWRDIDETERERESAFTFRIHCDFIWNGARSFVQLIADIWIKTMRMEYTDGFVSVYVCVLRSQKDR